MNVIVSAAAERESGGLMIYKQFLSHLPEYIGENHYFIFIDPDMPAPEISGVTYFPIDLRGMKKRMSFDSSRCRTILAKQGVRADKLISFQNTGVNALRDIPQLVYYHQAIPFYHIRWNPFKAAERRMYLYKRVYPLFVKNSIGPKTHIAVQTAFIKTSFARLFHFDLDRIHVLFPDVKKIDRDAVTPFSYEEKASHFIYPATAFVHKNHQVLIEALQVLRDRYPVLSRIIRVHFTVTEQDAPGIAETVKTGGLNQMVLLEGGVPFDVLLRKYMACKALLFPSRIETLGLPLVEAASLGLPILASDLEYSHDVLEGYAGARFLPTSNPEAWAEQIAELAKAELKRYPYEIKRDCSWPEFFRIVSEM